MVLINCWLHIVLKIISDDATRNSSAIIATHKLHIRELTSVHAERQNSDLSANKLISGDNRLLDGC